MATRKAKPGTGLWALVCLNYVAPVADRALRRHARPRCRVIGEIPHARATPPGAVGHSDRHADVVRYNTSWHLEFHDHRTSKEAYQAPP
jgi:hypothetical protein